MRLLVLILFITAILSCQSNEPISLHGQTMGTTYHITLADSQMSGIEPDVVQIKIDSLLANINQQMSTYKKNSEITLFNNHMSSEPFIVSRSFSTVLKQALIIYHESDGAFDVTVSPLVNLWGFGNKGKTNNRPSATDITSALGRVGSRYIDILNDTTIQKTNPQASLDFGAIAKGYGVDVVAEFLSQYGIQNFLVEIGGEIIVRGTKNSKPWRVGIDRPLAGAQPGADLQRIIELSDIAMATSGDYRNYFTVGDSSYSHEIDPRTGQSIVTGVASVTVLAPSCMLADAMATAIMVMGAEKGLKWIESKPNVEALIILHDSKDFIEITSSNFNKSTI